MRRARVPLVVPHPTDPSIALVELTQGYWAIIDSADAALVGQFYWFAMQDQGKWLYAASKLGGRKRTSLHKFIAEVAGIDSTSGVKGVTWAPACGKWHVRVQAGKRMRSLGYHLDKDAAVAIATAARLQLHGEFANHGVFQ